MCLLLGINWVLIFQKTTFFIATAMSTSNRTQDRNALQHWTDWPTPIRREENEFVARAGSGGRGRMRLPSSLRRAVTHSARFTAGLYIYNGDPTVINQNSSAHAFKLSYRHHCDASAVHLTLHSEKIVVSRAESIETTVDGRVVGIVIPPPPYTFDRKLHEPQSRHGCAE
jgi:hypothetical protein